jgi:hypothetical protein
VSYQRSLRGVGANDVVAVSTEDQLTRCLTQEARSVAVCSAAVERWGFAFSAGAISVAALWFYFGYVKPGKGKS